MENSRIITMFKKSFTKACIVVVTLYSLVLAFMLVSSILAYIYLINLAYSLFYRIVLGIIPLIIASIITRAILFEIIDLGMAVHALEKKGLATKDFFPHPMRMPSSIFLNETIGFGEKQLSRSCYGLPTSGLEKAGVLER